MEIGLLERLYEDVEAHYDVLKFAKDHLKLPDCTTESVYDSIKVFVQDYIDNSIAFTEDGERYEGPVYTCEEDMGIGHYEYWGVIGVHRDVFNYSCNAAREQLFDAKLEPLPVSGDAD